MSLTVADVLALPGLESMRLRAGQIAQSNPVRWPYVAENTDIAEWIMGGELVFVTGINHPRTEQNLLSLVQQAHERAAAGLVILTGPEYIRQIPPSVIDAAQQLDVPLIEQPYALKMVIVTQAIGTALVQAQMLGRSRQHLLEQLLEGDVQSLEALRQRAQSLGLPLATPRQVALFKLEGSDRLLEQLSAEDAELRLQDCRERLQQSLLQQLQALGDTLSPVCQGEHWIALLPATNSLDQQHNREAMLASLNQLNPSLAPLRLYLGLSTGGHGPERFAHALNEARQALVAAQSFPERLGVCSFNELGALELLGAIRDRSLLDQFVDKVLGPIISDDARHEPVLMPTLEAWFQENGNLALAAQRLGVHRNTLSYRTQRIESLSGNSFSNPHDRLNISLALLIWRLSSSRPARSTA
ncbi:PucR family transcriptional regulator [Pseudomonas marincola]|uniref:PucR family transcriptional regulator n=1 Tax=Pseudomonas marincola TaxID=437900 RepID=UPI0008E86528|nr:PucR family transcriptional regulator [Pseudomonas marincola]SFU05129.1 Sugar diacid utilization regulator [Pseudomonas marincola]